MDNLDDVTLLVLDHIKLTWFLGEMLYESEYSIVFKVYDTKHVAQVLKVYKRKLNTKHRNEIEMMKLTNKLNCVVKLLNYQIIFNRMCIFTEYDEDYVDLFTFITYNLPEITVKTVFTNVVNACILLDDNNIFHGDIKDENILVNKTSLAIKIIDFGDSVMKQNIKNLSYIGTDIFSPIEYLLNQQVDVDKTTVWSLGCLLHSISKNAYPYEERLEVGRKSLNLNPKIACDNLILLCLNNDVNLRISIHKILDHPWFKITERYLPE